MNQIDIILITCNRLAITKQTVDDLWDRLKTPFRLIVIDDTSVDGTGEYLKEQKDLGRVHELAIVENTNICQAYNKGYEFVESEYFICMQDDITVPDLDPCVIQQLIGLMEKYPEQASIGCRIQRVPNLDESRGNEDLIPARKAASAYFRIHRKSDVDKLGKDPFGNRVWDDLAWPKQARDKLGMEVSWARNLWADHSRGYCRDRGYIVKPRKWGAGIHSRTRQAHVEKPYPAIDPKTNVPLYIVNADRKVDRGVNPDADYWGTRMRTRISYYDEKILNEELNPEKNIYRIPPNPTCVVDIGAHIGGTTIRAAKAGAVVFAFEPELYNFEILSYNVRKNGVRDRVNLLNLGVGEPGRVKLYVHPRISGTTSSFLDQKGLEADNYQIASIVSIHHVFDFYNIDHCDLLKIDNEGGEIAIIRDFDDDLASKVDQISLEFHNKETVEELVSKLSKWYEPENTKRYEWVFRKLLPKAQE